MTRVIYNYTCTRTSYSPYSGEGATVSRPYRYSHGSEQQFTEEAYTVAPAEMEEQMTYDPENGQSTFPIAVLMETARNEGLGNRSKVVDKFISCLAPPTSPLSPLSPLPSSPPFPPSRQPLPVPADSLWTGQVWREWVHR